MRQQSILPYKTYYCLLCHVTQQMLWQGGEAMLDTFLQQIFEPKYHVLQAALMCFPGFSMLLEPPGPEPKIGN